MNIVNLHDTDILIAFAVVRKRRNLFEFWVTVLIC